MALHSVHEYLKPVKSLAAADWAAASNTGAAVDTLGYEDALVIFDVGDVTGTGTLAAKVQECDTTNGTWADITGATFTLISTVSTDAQDLLMYNGRIALGGRKRYLRAYCVVANIASEFSINFVLAAAQVLPVSQSQANSFNLDPS